MDNKCVCNTIIAAATSSCFCV